MPRPGKRINFDIGWRFTPGDMEAASGEMYDHSGWRLINLPHDWSIEGSYVKGNATGKRCGFLPAGIGWYRKYLYVPSQWAGKDIFIEFDGVYMNSDVWINGHHLGHRPYGYIGFEYELTRFLHPGVNLLAVRVDCSRQPSSRWYNGSGIYRHVWLTAVNPIHISHWGCFVRTEEVTSEKAKVISNITLKNSTRDMTDVIIGTIIVGTDGSIVCSNRKNFALKGCSLEETEAENIVSSPVLWSPDNPAIYSLIVQITGKAGLIDEYTVPFGIRTVEFIPNKGFFLNGTSMKFRGVCLHHDAGPVGAAVPDALMLKRLRMLKDMGCNSVRTSHNPFAPEFYDMCDKLGLMVMDEAFDGWEETKAEADYGLHFGEWWEEDLRSMVLRDRNHPSVILWSIGNEVHHMNSATTAMLQDFIHELDPTRCVTCGIQGTEADSDENRAILDVAGYNDGGGACFVYERDHERRPDQLFVATEAPHTLQTRGFYRTQTWWRDINRPRIEIPDLTPEEIFFDGSSGYNSSYDNSGVRTCSRDSWGLAEKYPYLCGEFRWTGFDYLGEASHWPFRSGNFGIVDLANLKKDHYYLYQSMWTKEPMIHLLPHWTHNGMEGTAIPVWVYTNCSEAELFLNGENLGRKTKGGNRHLSWDVAYSPGELRAVGYIEGKAQVEKIIRTAGIPEKIALSTDNSDLITDSADIAQVTFEITDENGITVPYADNLVQYNINGPGRLIGMENGRPDDLTPPSASRRRAFYGMGMGLVQATFDSGDISVVASGILGETVFCEKTRIAIITSAINLRGAACPLKYDIYYTLDGTEPDNRSIKYEGCFEIYDTMLVKALIMADGKRFAEHEYRFIKGRRPKVSDPDHGINV